MKKTLAIIIVLCAVISNLTHAVCYDGSSSGNVVCSLNTDQGSGYYDGGRFYIPTYLSDFYAGSHVVSLANDGGAQVSAVTDANTSLYDYVYGPRDTANSEANYFMDTGGSGYVDLTVQILGGGGYGYIACFW